MKFWTIWTFAVLAAAFPFDDVSLHKRDGTSKHIGYRIVSKQEAEAIQANSGKAVQSVGTGGRQLGTGTYISPAFNDYPEYDDSKGLPWDCVVTMDSDTWDGLNKAWIPKFYEFPEDLAKTGTCKPLPLWTPRYVANRKRFLTSLDASFTVDNTVLFAVVLGHDDKTQALFPKAMIDEGILRLEQCAERGSASNQQIGALGTANWNTESMPGWGIGIDK